MVIANIVAFVLVVIGCLNWGLVGIFGFNLVTAIFGVGTVGTLIAYIIITLSAIWLIVSACLTHGKIWLRDDDR